MLVKGMRINIGKVTTVRAWTDPWLSMHTPKLPQPKRPMNENTLTCYVKDWINKTGTRWDEGKSKESSDPSDADKILSLKLCLDTEHDLLG